MQKNWWSNTLQDIGNVLVAIAIFYVIFLFI